MLIYWSETPIQRQQKINCLVKVFPTLEFIPADSLILEVV